MTASGSNFTRDIKLTFWDNLTKTITTATENSAIKDLYNGSIGNYINAGMKQFTMELLIGSLDKTNSDETYKFTLQTAPLLTFAADIVTHSELTLTRGFSGMEELSIPKIGPRAKFLRFMRISLAVTGTTPKVTSLSASLICREHSNQTIIHATYPYG